MDVFAVLKSVSSIQFLLFLTVWLRTSEPLVVLRTYTRYIEMTIMVNELSTDLRYQQKHGRPNVPEN